MPQNYILPANRLQLFYTQYYTLYTSEACFWLAVAVPIANHGFAAISPVSDLHTSEKMVAPNFHLRLKIPGLQIIMHPGAAVWIFFFFFCGGGGGGQLQDWVKKGDSLEKHSDHPKAEFGPSRMPKLDLNSQQWDDERFRAPKIYMTKTSVLSHAATSATAEVMSV